MNKEIILEPKHELKDFLIFGYSNLFSSWAMKLVVLLSFIALTMNVLYFFDLLDVKSIFSDGIPTTNLIVPIIVLVVLPLVMYFLIKTSFEKNFRLKEKSKIIINQDNLIEEGETYSVVTPWNKIEMITQKSSLFLIKNDRFKKGFISKRHFTTEQLIDFKQIIKSTNVKSNF